MPPGIAKRYGLPLWDLFEHLIFQDYEIDGEEWHFASVPGIVPGMHLDSARLEIFFSGIRGLGESTEPSYVIDLIYDDGLELWHGWLGATYHRAYRWTIGPWHQDITDPLDWFDDASEFGIVTQCRSLEEVHRASEKELAKLCQRLARCARVGQYRLEWSEMAAMAFHFQDRWNSRPSNVDSWHAGVHTIRHGHPIVTDLLLEDEILLTLRTRHDQFGWSVDLFRPQPTLEAVGDCSWQSAVIFDGDYDRRQSHICCPLPDHRHHDTATMTPPWSLVAHIEQEWYHLRR